jgi:transposase-like protein
MRYPASEKLEIIKSVEQSHLPVRRTLEKLGIARTTFYHWYDLYRSGGPEALADRRSRPWNRIPDAMREKIVRLALDEPTLSPRELSVRFTDSEKYFVSEASVYRAAGYSLDPAYLEHERRTPISPGPGDGCRPCRHESRSRSDRRCVDRSTL